MLLLNVPIDPFATAIKSAHYAIVIFLITLEVEGSYFGASGSSSDAATRYQLQGGPPGKKTISAPVDERTSHYNERTSSPLIT